MKILGTICARAGSKGVKNKNIRELNGKPLIAYTVEFFKKWGKAEKIICSTDSEKISKIAKEYGAEIPFLRPVELATDNASKLDVLKHALKFCEREYNTKYDIIVDLDPTSPLRKIRDLDDSFEKFLKSDANNLYSVVRAHKNPYFNMIELDKNNYAHLSKKGSFVRRQDAPVVYEMNASIYIYKRNFLLNTKSVHSEKTITHEMTEFESIDIDREIDFLFIEFLLKNEVFVFD